MATICQILFIILLTLTTRSEFMAISPSTSLKRLSSFLFSSGCTLSLDLLTYRMQVVFLVSWFVCLFVFWLSKPDSCHI